MNKPKRVGQFVWLPYKGCEDLNVGDWVNINAIITISDSGGLSPEKSIIHIQERKERFLSCATPSEIIEAMANET